MVGTESTSAMDYLRSPWGRLWLFACLGFVVGDIATTSIGLRLDGVTELNPLVADFFAFSVLGTMTVLKVAVLGGSILLWNYLPRPHCRGVPLGLATTGVLVTAWNCVVLGQFWLY